MKKYRQVSPERAKVWTERSPKYVQNRRVHVVYYLSRNRQLEHPHFIEVTISSAEGLYLRDVIERLNVLRGRGMASMYSWSCKRSYKNGFVWQDLCEDDLIFPVHGNEYVLKGSEIIEESNSGHLSPAVGFNMQTVKHLPEPPSSRSLDEASSSSTLNGKEIKDLREDDISPSQRSGSSGVSPDSRAGNHSPYNGSLSLTECTVRNERSVDAWTQTEESDWKAKPRETCTRGVSTDDGISDGDRDGEFQNHVESARHKPSNCDACSPELSPYNKGSSSGRKTETLEALIRADASKISSSRAYEDRSFRMSPNPKAKASSMLMQLISCGSISVKDHGLGLIPSFKPTLSHSKFPSPLYSTSVMLGELDCFSESRRLFNLRLEDKEYFSGSLIETKILKDGDGCASLKRSSSYNSERINKRADSVDHEEVPTGRSKCIANVIKSSLIKQPRSESMRSPSTDKPRLSGNGFDESRALTKDPSSTGGSSRMTECSSGNKQVNRPDSFREDKIFRIEERLASGARVIIQSKEPDPACSPLSRRIPAA